MLNMVAITRTVSGSSSTIRIVLLIAGSPRGRVNTIFRGLSSNEGRGEHFRSGANLCVWRTGEAFGAKHLALRRLASSLDFTAPNASPVRRVPRVTALSLLKVRISYT